MNDSELIVEAIARGEDSSDNVLTDKLQLSALSLSSQSPGELPPGNLPVTIVLVAILFISVVINFVILYYVTSLPKRKRKRPATVLVAHLSCVAILFAALVIAFLTERIFLWQFSGQIMCQLVTFFKFTIVGVFSLNIIAIIYERFREFNRFNWGNLLLCRLISLIWIAAIVTSIPTFFMVEYKENPLSIGNNTMHIREDMKKRVCKSVPLLGMLGATIIYELLRFILFHGFVVCYMAYAIYKIRSKLAHLHFLKPLPNMRTRKKVKTIRFILIHFTVFILIWFPIGVLAFTYRVMYRRKRESTNIPVVTNILGIFLLLYLVLNPLIYLCLDVGCYYCVSYNCCCQRTNSENNRWDGESVADRQNHLDSTQVNAITCKRNGMKIRRTASESDIKSKVHSRTSLCSRESKGHNKKLQVKFKCGSLVELQSLDVSRVSTFAVTSSS